MSLQQYNGEFIIKIPHIIRYNPGRCKTFEVNPITDNTLNHKKCMNFIDNAVNYGKAFWRLSNGKKITVQMKKNRMRTHGIRIECKKLDSEENWHGETNAKFILELMDEKYISRQSITLTHSPITKRQIIFVPLDKIP